MDTHGGISREEFIEHERRFTGLSREEFDRLFVAEACDCGGSRCWGWQLVLIPGGQLLPEEGE